MSESKYEPVVFENSNGDVISNDPVWLAQRTLAQAGLVSEQRAAAAQQARDDAEDELGEDEEDRTEDYKSYDGRALKTIAKERNIDISDLKKVGEVRARLIEADVTAAAQAEVDAANSGE